VTEESNKTGRGRGGARKGSGRKPQWPEGTALKSMRLPASLEGELRQFAQDRLKELAGADATRSLEKITKPKRATRSLRVKAQEITFENAQYWIVIHKDTDEVLNDTLARTAEDAIGKAQRHFNNVWWQDLEPDGWEVFPIAIELPSWRGKKR